MVDLQDYDGNLICWYECMYRLLRVIIMGCVSEHVIGIGIKKAV